MQFMRCSCELWLAKQRPDLAPPTDPSRQRVFDEGNIVDAWAQKLFPGAVNVDGFGHRAAKNTQQAIANGATALLQPTFMANAISCRADILVKSGDDAWDIYEVKSSTSVKKEHVFDVAFQRICLEEAGIHVGRTFLLHINNKYVRDGEIDPQQLFTKVDVTHEVENVLPLARIEIPRALEVLDWSKTPGILQASSCTDPKKCKSLPCYLPELGDEDLYSIATSLPKEKLVAFLERGLLKPEHVPADIMAELSDLKLPPRISDEPIIAFNKDEVRAQFSTLQYPLYFLDYETIFPAVPLFNGYRPYQHTAFQYSLHILREVDAEPEHVEFLADECVDPAPAIAASLQKHIGGTGSIFVWSQRFEAARNAEMGRHIPTTAEFMASMNERMYDLMLLVKKGHYVDSRFNGSASIKKVLPVICPELSYTALAIHDGGTASASWATLTNINTPPAQKEQLKKDMLAYCGLDTFGMVAIYKRLVTAIK